MSFVRNARIAAGQITNTAYNVVYTVPTGYVLLLKFVGLHNLGSAASGVQIILTTGPGNPNFSLQIVSVAPSTTTNFQGWTALNGGDEILLLCTAQPINYWIAGALLPYNAALT